MGMKRNPHPRRAPLWAAFFATIGLSGCATRPVVTTDNLLENLGPTELKALDAQLATCAATTRVELEDARTNRGYTVADALTVTLQAQGCARADRGLFSAQQDVRPMNGPAVCGPRGVLNCAAGSPLVGMQDVRLGVVSVTANGLYQPPARPVWEIITESARGWSLGRPVGIRRTVETYPTQVIETENLLTVVMLATQPDGGRQIYTPVSVPGLTGADVAARAPNHPYVKSAIYDAVENVLLLKGRDPAITLSGPAPILEPVGLKCEAGGCERFVQNSTGERRFDDSLVTIARAMPADEATPTNCIEVGVTVWGHRRVDVPLVNEVFVGSFWSGSNGYAVGAAGIATTCSDAYGRWTLKPESINLAPLDFSPSR